MSSMNAYHNEQGASKLTVLIFGSLAAAIVYLSYLTIPIYYAFYELENQMYALAKKGQVLSNDEIRRRLANDIKKLKIPALPEDIKIVRGDRDMQIALSYDEPLIVGYGETSYKLHTFEFVAFVKEPFVGTRSGR
jgi:hypothetical protein